jgi:hypothetical protein
MATFAVIAAGFFIGAARGIFSLLISAIVLAVVTFVVYASEGVIRAGICAIGWVFVLDAGFVVAIAASALAPSPLSKYLPIPRRNEKKMRRNSAYGEVSRPRG